MRLPYRLLLLATAAAIAACTSSTEVLPDQDALDASVQLRAIAEDAFRAGADPDVMSAYRDVAFAVSGNGRVSPITIVVDGVPLDFLATAQQLDAKGGPACDPPQMLCVDLPSLRSVVAWERGNPRRMVQLTAPTGGGAIGQPVPAILPIPFLTGATLTYFDGTGGVYLGTSGTQQISTTALSDQPCTLMPPGVVSAPEYFRCTRADFRASFDGGVAPPPFAVRANSAAGTHTIAMAEQSVRGARLEFMGALFGCGLCDPVLPFLVAPPIKLRGGDLRATLTATVAAPGVRFELRVTNPKTVPVTLQFTSGQQFDVRVRRPDGSTAWVWSADKAFTQALTSRTLAPGESAVYTAEWSPAAKGSFIADGRLTSSSHFALAAVGVTVP